LDRKAFYSLGFFENLTLKEFQMIAVLAAYKGKRNRAARERALVLAAGKLFASRGYDSTTTREIAAVAGCAEGLIHRYFKGKAGLLAALIQHRGVQEVVDLNERLPLAPTIEEEINQLVNWEVERMWADREFLRVIIPQALLDPDLGRLLRETRPQIRGHAIGERLKKFKECQTLSNPDLEALAQFVSVMGFMFGFMRPAVLRQDREDGRKMAMAIARLLGRSFQLGDLPEDGQNYPPEVGSPFFS
jgi:TetR/AcrR family transcriptional regulator, regulator of cefoperazone and chloramphenicol sensitivity